MSASKAYNDARTRAKTLEAEAIANDPGVKAVKDRLAAEEHARAEVAAKAKSDAERAEWERRARGTNWKEYLKVGMTEAEANDLFDAIPRNGESTLRKTTESVSAHLKTVAWKRDVMTYRLQGNVQVPAGPRTDRLCTITFEDGKVTAIDY